MLSGTWNNFQGLELFTSEGSSSCPPADALLAKLDRAGVIVLSEHVDYWNYIGWSDPFSSKALTERQQRYAEKLRIDSVYTPQMVVDGTAEFVGSDAGKAKAAVLRGGEMAKLRVNISGEAKWMVEVDVGDRGDEVYLAVASNEELSKVLRGENDGRSLRHVAVVKSLVKIGDLKPGEAFHKEIAAATGTQRIVAFVQERGQGRVLGSAMRSNQPSKTQSTLCSRQPPGTLTEQGPTDSCRLYPRRSPLRFFFTSIKEADSRR